MVRAVKDPILHQRTKFYKDRSNLYGDIAVGNPHLHTNKNNKNTNPNFITQNTPAICLILGYSDNACLKRERGIVVSSYDHRGSTGIET